MLKRIAALAIAGALSLGLAQAQGTNPGSSPLTIAKGGTGGATAAAARTSLGLAIGTNVQAYDADLAAIAGLTTAADKCQYWTGAGTAALIDCKSWARSFIAAADASAGRTSIGLAIGTDVQAYDADLAALAANSTDGLWAHTGSGTGSARTLTAPAAGFTITNPAGIAGNPTFVLANDLAALEAMSGTGLVSRTASETYAQRTITGTAAEITASNGDGVSGNPTLSLPAALTFTGKTITGGTFASPVLTTPALGTPASGVATNLTGTAAGLTAGAATVLSTTRSIYGNNFDGSAALAQIIASTYGGTGNGFTKFAGPATAERTFTLPNTDATLAYHAENLSVFAATTSAQLAGVLSDETGTGTAVFSISPALTGTPTAPTAAGGTNTTQIASTAFVQAAVVASTTGVASIAGNTGAFTLGTGLTNSTNDLRVSLSTATNVLSGDVALNNTANYFDGPSMAQGTSGTWSVSGSVVLLDATAGGAVYFCKLWDGTTVIASTTVFAVAGGHASLTLSGYLASPAANIKISCRDSTTVNGSIKFNSSGNSKDSSIFGTRIAP